MNLFSGLLAEGGMFLTGDHAQCPRGPLFGVPQLIRTSEQALNWETSENVSTAKLNSRCFTHQSWEKHYYTHHWKPILPDDI